MKRIALIVLVLLSLSCATRKPGGGIAGTVAFDGMPLPGVLVSVSTPAGARTAVTDEQGEFRFAGLPAGRHRVTAELEGFTRVQHSVVVAEGAVAQLEAVMRLAAVAETITVTAQAPALLQTTATSAALYLSDAITETHLPLGRGREHAFVETANERVTTFSIDVDRASYGMVRRRLASNVMPAPDMVRIEEMVNYFTYSYPQPAGGEPFSITTEVAGCPWNVKSRLLRIGIQGRNLDEWRMAPNNLVFLIDVSGSMDQPDKLPLVVDALRLLAGKLRAEDSVAIVVYAGAAGLVLPRTSGAEQQTILAALERLEAGGSTAGAQGIALAYDVAREGFLAEGNNRVILATDGDFNVGPASTEELQQLIEKQRESGVFLTTIGVGDIHDDAMLELLADKGNGNYAYLDSMAEAKKVFERELTGTLVAIAKDVKVQLEFNPAVVASYRQVGYENRALANEDFEDDGKDAGELGAGHFVTALYEIVPVAPGVRGTVAEVRLRYKEPDGTASRLLTATAADEGRSLYDANADMQFAAAVAQFGMLLLRSPHAGSSTYDEAAQLARIARGADLDGTRGELVAMLEKAKTIAPPAHAVLSAPAQ